MQWAQMCTEILNCSNQVEIQHLSHLIYWHCVTPYVSLSGCFSYSIIRLKWVRAFVQFLQLMVINWTLSHLNPNQGSFNTGSLHLYFFLLSDHRWFYVTFRSSWLLKWDLAIHTLSKAWQGWELQIKYILVWVSIECFYDYKED